MRVHPAADLPDHMAGRTGTVAAVIGRELLVMFDGDAKLVPLYAEDLEMLP